MIGEENFVSILDGESGLVLVRQESSHIFWSSSLEHLGEHEVGKAVDTVIGVFGQIVLRVASLSLLSRSFLFDLIGHVVFLQDENEFLQMREKPPGILIGPMR